MPQSRAVTPLLLVLVATGALGQTQIPVHDARMRMALRWVQAGWNEKATLYFTNLLSAGDSLSQEAREVLNVLIDRPDLEFRFPTRFSGLITVPERTPTSLRYLRLIRKQPDCESLWTGTFPDLPRLAELELVQPGARRQAREFLATRILLLQGRPNGAVTLQALKGSLQEQVADIEGDVILQQGARQLLLAAFQMADEYTEGRFPRQLYQWLQPTRQ